MKRTHSMREPCGRSTASWIRAALLLAPAILWSSDIRAATPPAFGPFVLGADISALDAPGRGRFGANRVYQENGQTNDEMSILFHHGWTAFRLRVFVAPVRQAPNNTVEAAIPLARRIKATGATFLLDLHFSDTWADPQHQEIPSAWTNLDFDELEACWELHGSNVVKQFKDAGAMSDWVQIGNEITRGAAWPLAQLKVPGSVKYNPPEPYDETTQWQHLTRLLKAGIRGVRAASGDTPPRIVIHIDQGGNWGTTEWFFDHLEQAQVDYDVIAESFYPPWHHGTLEQLLDNMNQCAARYHKDFLVAETGYERSHSANNEDMLWPVTPEGRLQFMADIVNTVRNGPRGLGVMYWAPEWDIWNTNGTPGPAVFVLDNLTTLTNRPASHLPAVVQP